MFLCPPAPPVPHPLNVARGYQKQGSGGSNASAGDGWLITTAPLRAMIVRNARRNFFMTASLTQ